MRVEDFLKERYAESVSHIGIITHGGVIRSVLSYYLGLPQYKRFTIKPYNCGISRVRYDRTTRQSEGITINEISHLEGIATF